MSGFIEWLEDSSAGNSRVRAVLRRSLAFEPGAFPGAYPYVEPFLKGEGFEWRRKAYYLTAGLWAHHWREGRNGVPTSVGKACAHYKTASKSESTELRFINLLDADMDQLPYRLRQMVALLKDQNLDFEDLLKSILDWNNDQKKAQNAWARDFYRNLDGNNTKERTAK